MTNKTNTFPKLTAAQERAWEYIQAWYAQPDHAETFYSGRADRGVTIHAVPVGKNTLEALWNKGMVKHVERKPWQPLLYTIHPDYIPATPEPAPAEAPAQPSDTPEPQPVNNAPVKSRIDASMGYTERYKPENWRSETPTNPGYDSLKALADKQDEYIQALETRVKELEGDMERLAVREMELLQQNSVLFHSLDRIAASQEKLQTAAHDACAEYGGDMAEDAMHTLADTIGYPWN